MKFRYTLPIRPGPGGVRVNSGAEACEFRFPESTRTDLQFRRSSPVTGDADSAPGALCGSESGVLRAPPRMPEADALSWNLRVFRVKRGDTPRMSPPPLILLSRKGPGFPSQDRGIPPVRRQSCWVLKDRLVLRLGCSPYGMDCKARDSHHG